VTVLGSDPACEHRVREWTETSRARFAVGDLLHAPWPDRSFDVVVCYHLLPHVHGWRTLVTELSRLARFVVLIDYPTMRSANVVATRLFGLKKSVEGDTRPFAVFSDSDVEGAFSSRGFVPTGRRPQFLFPMALHRAARSAGLARALEWAGAMLGLRALFGSPVILRVERRG
jgi:hypothetical protein